MKQIKNFIIERLILNRQSSLNTKLSENEAAFKEIVNNFKQLQKNNKLEPFYIDMPVIITNPNISKINHIKNK